MTANKNIKKKASISDSLHNNMPLIINQKEEKPIEIAPKQVKEKKESVASKPKPKPKPTTSKGKKRTLFTLEDVKRPVELKNQKVSYISEETHENYKLIASLTGQKLYVVIENVLRAFKEMNEDEIKKLINDKYNI